MENNKELRFAVIGVGYWASLQIQAWSEVKGAKLVAICNRTVSTAREFASKYNIPNVYGDAEEMFQKEKLDFVDIITYPSAHLQSVLLAAKYKVPVICQKPIAFDLESCLAMQKACKDAGIPFYIHENYRWQQPKRGVREILDEGIIGEPFRAHIQLSYGSAETFVTEASMLNYIDFALTDMCPHLFDLSMFFFGEPQSIYCQTYKSLDFLSSDDIVCAMLRFGNVICTCEISSLINYRVFIEGKKGSLELGVGENITIKAGKEVSARQYPSPHYSWVSDYDENYHGRDCIHSIVQCNRHLFNALSTGQLPETSGDAELKVMKIIEAARESSRSNRVVQLAF
jgi:D-apiose dehydrogenase